MLVIDLIGAVTARPATAGGAASEAAPREVHVAETPAATAGSKEAFGRPFSELDPAQQRVLVRRWLEADTPAQPGGSTEQS